MREQPGRTSLPLDAFHGLRQGARLLAISPHLDDAVFGCGDLLARYPGSVVITVFAGGPPSPDPPTPWDRASGFCPGDHPVSERRLEDQAALQHLGAAPVWLPFWDSQYQRSPSVPDIVPALVNAIVRAGPDTILLPLGLWHSDHILTHAASLRAVERLGIREWFVYADAIYRRFQDSGCADRQAALGVGAPLGGASPASRRKREAIRCYQSQLRALETEGRAGWRDALEPEIIWPLHRRERR